MSGDGELAGRLAELAALHGLTPGQLAILHSILATLAGDGRAPTTVRAPIQAVDVHIADSLAALEIEAVRAAKRLVDIGSGAGFPGIALAVALPQARVVLLEGQIQKWLFARDLLNAAGVSNARAVNARAEDWRDGLGRHDLATARAIAPQPVVLEYAAPLLCVGGSLVDWRGSRDADEEAATMRAARELGMEPDRIHPSRPYAGVRDRHLHVFTKVAETPARYPRRPGAARKRPLGGAPP